MVTGLFLGYLTEPISNMGSSAPHNCLLMHSSWSKMQEQSLRYLVLMGA